MTTQEQDQIEQDATVSPLPMIEGEPVEWVAEHKGDVGIGSSPLRAIRDLIREIKLSTN